MSPKLSIIEGGGRKPRPPDPPRHSPLLRDLIIEVLRGVARGHDQEGRIEGALVALLAFLQETDEPIADEVDRLLRELQAKLPRPSHDQHPDRINLLACVLCDGLKVAAESFATDDAAPSRTLRWLYDFEAAIRTYPTRDP